VKTTLTALYLKYIDCHGLHTDGGVGLLEGKADERAGKRSLACPALTHESQLGVGPWSATAGTNQLGSGESARISSLFVRYLWCCHTFARRCDNPWCEGYRRSEGHYALA
jgi:hypothetical protein